MPGAFAGIGCDKGRCQIVYDNAWLQQRCAYETQFGGLFLTDSAGGRRRCHCFCHPPVPIYSMPLTTAGEERPTSLPWTAIPLQGASE